MDIEIFKLIAFGAIFVSGMAGGLFSKWIATTSKSKILFSLGNVFAGGVFLGAGLIHMLPDAQEGFATIAPDSDYPWFALICCSGFLFILLLEYVFLKHQHENAPSAANDKIIYPYVLMFILSIHSIITGFALGIEDRIVQAAVILLAVLAHKSTAAFALGISLQKNETEPKKFMSFIAYFSMMTPLGLLLGYLFSIWLKGSLEQIFEAVFDALAAGTFIYVAVLDILINEFSTNDRNLQKFIFVLAGLALMAIVAVWT